MLGVNSARNWYTQSRHLGTQLIQFHDRGTQLVLHPDTVTCNTILQWLRLYDAEWYDYWRVINWKRVKGSGRGITCSIIPVLQPEGVVGIWTIYGLDDPRLDPRNDFIFSKTVPTGSETHWASHSMRTGVHSWGQKEHCVKLTTHPYLVPRLRISGLVPLLPLHTCMVWTGPASPLSIQSCH